MDMPIDMDGVKGFLADHEGRALTRYAGSVSALGPCLEVGSYCGKSTIYIGVACRDQGNVLYAIDHHRGSEEHQTGEEYHDPDLFDADSGQMDSFRHFRTNIESAGLSDTVIPIVTSSAVAAKRWATPLGLVFIDGGHSMEAAITDYRSWAGHIVSGGILAIHDIFFDPEAGGQAPHSIWRMAKASGLFEEVEIVDTLGLLRRA